MERPTFIARQSARPSGLIGWIIAGVMARETASQRAGDQPALRLPCLIAPCWRTGSAWRATVRLCAVPTGIARVRVTMEAACGVYNVVSLRKTDMIWALENPISLTGFGRVETWRGDVRLSMSVSAPFVWRCLSRHGDARADAI